MKKQQGGFTLIELVVVIVILGILSVYAAPKFINIQSDARIATLRGAEGAIKGANALVYSKAAIGGVEGAADDTVTIDGVDTKIAYGYVQEDYASIANILDADIEQLTATTDVAAAEWGIYVDTTASNLKVVPKGFSAGQACHLIYVEATNTTRPDYSILATDC
ncbi:prepilin-type N-terminal cleavage/methylation domain-containing protein [Ferrimonas marina]|uniref:MSHA pilin protein MshA n=1 Tax=Ferrimonas marina TaxID=299255 RepID=A0A1M5Y0X2_9GAMM|nr:prepilin-type N-terminal cleavage/methylation domain-containing protein [Ferrimonas marina]SHI05589.1 MSHA pilin protein MshA [Ferrimonas marina]